MQPKDIRIWEAVAVLTASGTKEPRRFWKFWHQVINGPELVCGWEVP